MARSSLVIAAAALALPLASCAPMTAPQPVYVHVCPVAPAYTAAFESQAASELAAMGSAYPAVQKLIADYGTVRKEIRQCQKG